MSDNTALVVIIGIVSMAVVLLVITKIIAEAKTLKRQDPVAQRIKAINESDLCMVDRKELIQSALEGAKEWTNKD